VLDLASEVPLHIPSKCEAARLAAKFCNETCNSPVCGADCTNVKTRGAFGGSRVVLDRVRLALQEYLAHKTTPAPLRPS